MNLKALIAEPMGQYFVFFILFILAINGIVEWHKSKRSETQ